MATTIKLPQWRTLTGSALFIIARIGLVVFFASGLMALLPPHALSIIGATSVVLVSLLMLIGAAISLQDKSLLWQGLLQSIAAGGIIVGLRIVLNAVFDNWHVLNGNMGITGFGSLGLGVGAALLLNRVQSPKKRKRKKQAKLVANS